MVLQEASDTISRIISIIAIQQCLKSCNLTGNVTADGIDSAILQIQNGIRVQSAEEASKIVLGTLSCILKIGSNRLGSLKMCNPIANLCAVCKAYTCTAIEEGITCFLCLTLSCLKSNRLTLKRGKTANRRSDGT